MIVARGEHGEDERMIVARGEHSEDERMIVARGKHSSNRAWRGQAPPLLYYEVSPLRGSLWRGEATRFRV